MGLTAPSHLPSHASFRFTYPLKHRLTRSFTLSFTPSHISPLTPLLVGSGNMYIAGGSTTPVLQKVAASTGVLTIIAGTGTAGSLYDGGPATLAQLSSGALACAADMGGNIFVNDQNNHAIRQVSPNPSISGSYIMTTVTLNLILIYSSLSPTVISLIITLLYHEQITNGNRLF